MAERKEIHVEIDPEGNVSFDVHCAVGDECEQMVQPFEKALGEVREKRMKPERYRRQARTNIRGTNKER